jgi:hypothetical protein
LATIENYVRPQRLYRYRAITNHVDREIEAIEQGYLHCSAYTDLNDPMEGSFRSSSLLRRDDKYRIIKSEIMGQKSRTGLCSFSEVHNHELMWAHYTDQFSGICVAYSLSKLLHHLPDEVTFVRLYYDDKVPVVRNAHQEPNDQAKMILSYKNYRWLYEREWRMFAYIGNVHYHNVKCVTHVYLGSKIDPELKHRVTQALERLKIKTSEMNVTKYKLEFV